MAKNIRKMFAMVLVLCMILSALPMQALAEETTHDGLTITITPSEGSGSSGGESGGSSGGESGSESGGSSGGESSSSVSKVEVSGTSTSTGATVNMAGTKEVTSSTTEASGSSTTSTSTTVKLEGEVTENGVTKDVTWEETREETSTTNSDGSGTSNWKETGKETATYEQATNVPDVNVDLIVNGEAVEDPNGSAEITPDVPESADPKEGEDDTVYDETKITGTTDREVTADVEIGKTVEHKVITDAEGNVIDSYDSDKVLDLEAVNPDWNEEKKDVKAPIQKMTDEEIAAAIASGNKPEGYDFLYTGHGEDSLYGAGWGFSNGATNEAGCPVQQYQLTDATNPDALDIVTAYCTDIDTTSKSGYWYTIENLEDAGYYKTEGAEDHIRAIAANGYWGTEGTMTDKNGNEVPKTGSLDAMVALLTNAQSNGDEATKALLAGVDFNQLTEGEALVATQMAIWKYGNPYASTTDENGNTDEINLTANTLDYRTKKPWGGEEWVSSGTGHDWNKYWYRRAENTLGKTNEEIDAALNRINTVYSYLIGLSKPSEESESSEETEPTQIINEKNFIEDMSMTVGEMVKEDADGNGNSSYNVDFTFSLVVTPGDKDDMIVKVINSNGEVVGTGRIAGDGTQDSGFNSVIYNESDNSYTLKDMELVEGSNTKFNLKLEGAQYLEQGVYIYTSEVRNDVPSQTFVGMAEGYKSVDVAMEVDLTFHVEEGTVTTVREWADEGDPVVTPPAPPEPPEPPTREPRTWNPPQINRLANDDVVINEEPVPLATPARTGDSTGLWVALFLTVAFAMVAVNLFDKKRQHEAF